MNQSILKPLIIVFIVFFKYKCIYQIDLTIDVINQEYKTSTPLL